MVRRSLKRAFLVLASLALLLATAPMATAQTPVAQRIAAVVNESVISTQELRERLRLALLFSGLPGTVEAQRRLAPQVLRRVIDEQLQLQEARRQGVTVSRQEIQSALQNAAAANNMSTGQLIGVLNGQGINVRAFEQQIEAEIAWMRLVQRELANRAVVGEQQVELAMAVSPEAGRPEVLLSEILLPVYDPAEAQAVVANAEELRAAIREGGDFAAVAQQVSASASAAEGGDLGWVPLDAVQDALRGVLIELAPGQISDPIMTPSGVQLFHVRERRVSTERAIPDMRRVAQLLFPLTGNAPQAEVSQVLSQAREAAAQIGECRDVERLARQLALPNSGDLGWIRPVDMPGDMLQILRTLPVGSVSQPVRSGSGVHLLMVCADGRSAPDEARRADIRRTLEDEQLERLAGRYLRDLRKDAFIDVRING